MQPEAATLQNDPMLHGLRLALQGFRKKNQELIAKNAALKKGLSNEPNWEQEKKKLLDEKDSLASTLSMARKDLDSMAEDLESLRTELQKCETERNELDKRVKEKENEVQSLRKSLHLQKNETKVVKILWKAEQDRVSKMMLSIEKTFLESNAKWREWWLARQEEVAAELQTVCHITNDAVTGILTETRAMLQEDISIFASMKTTVQQIEAEWETRNRSLEDRLRFELATKENMFRQIEELQKQIKGNEDKWLGKEEERIEKENEMKAEMKLLLLKFAELQVSSADCLMSIITK